MSIIKTSPLTRNPNGTWSIDVGPAPLTGTFTGSALAAWKVLVKLTASTVGSSDPIGGDACRDGAGTLLCDICAGDCPDVGLIDTTLVIPGWPTR